MGYSNEELQMMGDDGNVDGCQGQDFWQSRAIPTDEFSGGMINTTEIVRPVRQDQSLGNAFPLEAIIRQTTTDGSHFVGEAFIGATFVGDSGCVYGVDDMGFIRKTARGVGKAGRAVGRGAVSTVKYTGKGAITAARYTGKGAAIAAKAVAKAAATPIRLAARPGYRALLKKHGGDKAKARSELLTRFDRSKNPAAKFAGMVLRHTGISGEEDVSMIGLTGPEISAMASSSAAAIMPIVKQIVADVAKDTASKATERGIERAIGSRSAQPMNVSIPPEERPVVKGTMVTPSDAQVDDVLDADPADESSGWEAGCCA